MSVTTKNLSTLPTVRRGYAAENLLGVAISRLVDVEPKSGRLFDESETKEADDLKCVVPVHGNLDVRKRAKLCEVLRLFERVSIKRRLCRLPERVSAECAYAVECA